MTSSWHPGGESPALCMLPEGAVSNACPAHADEAVQATLDIDLTCQSLLVINCKSSRADHQG